MFSRLSRSLFVLAATSVFSASVSGQFFQESFEGAPGGTYSLNGAFDDGGFDYFGQYAVPDMVNGARDDFTVGWDGSSGIHSQDNDGEGGPATVTVDVNGINITNYTSLSATVSLGALASELADSPFENYEAEDGDGISIFASIDGGSAVEIGRFSPPATGSQGTAGAGDLYLDADLDGVGTGTSLSAELADFVFPISGTGNTLDVSIALTSTGSFEPLAVDNLRVSGTMVPEPAGSVLLVFGLAFLAGSRRRSR